jgi:alpha-L-fucosidase
MLARIFLPLLLTTSLLAQPSVPPLPDAERTAWFKDAKFGMFIHWGPYSVIGRHEWARHQLQIPQAEYDQYAKQFNPVNFNSDEWVSIAQNAGAKYMVITSKHHDGFAIWRSKASDYDMEITPYPGDPMKQLAASAKKKGLRFGFYHSIMDWHHPDYRPQRAWETKTPNLGGNKGRYVDFMKEQLRELLTGYGDISMVWFDGEWEHTLRDLKRDDEVYDFIRNLQPNALINDRLYERQPGNRADFGTPEQFVPATGVTGPDGQPVLWESCVTINQDSWGYNKYETEFKTSRDLIRMLVEVVSKGGNLLLNVGPTPDGRIQQEFVTRLEAMGRWMKVNGESIYGTTASPFTRLPFFGRATVKNNNLYLHVFGWPKNGILQVPGLKNPVFSARILGLPGVNIPVKKDGDVVTLTLPEQPLDDAATVLHLKLDSTPVVEPTPIRPGRTGLITLGVESCEIETRFEQRAKKENALGHVFLTKWSRNDDIPYWDFAIPSAGRYKVELRYGKQGRSGVDLGGWTIDIAGQKLTGKIQNTGGAWVFKGYGAGVLALPAGTHKVKVSTDVKGSDAMQLEGLVLTPVR